MENRKMIYLDDAINALERKKYKNAKGDIGGLFYNEIIQNDIDALMQLPLAQPERPKGKWIVSRIPDSMLWECNQCGFDCGAHSFNFCPKCGADMRHERYRE